MREKSKTRYCKSSRSSGISGSRAGDVQALSFRRSEITDALSDPLGPRLCTGKAHNPHSEAYSVEA